MKKVRITDTILRDAHQSLMATRMRTRDMLPICEKLDKVGFFAIEAWGGATFDVSMRYLNEDPWVRIRTLKEHIPNTPLQMLLRGQNLVGYRHYADDVVEKFVELAAKNGVSIFRIFDALNDIRNMEVPIKAVREAGAHAQGAICYTISPVHTIDKFVEIAKELEKLGANSICIKDMAGLISPQVTYELVSALKRELKVPVNLHTHCTSGMGPMSCLAACQAGVDIFDTAFSPFSGGTSQPATETMVASLQGTPYDTGLDLELLVEIGYYFSYLREKYKGLISAVAERPDVSALIHQVPGGMISNLRSQLKEQNAMDRYEEVLKETPRVRRDLGYPPLVTPTSQIVGIQATLNVLSGGRYKQISEETKDYCRHLYGKPPAPIDPEIRKKIIGDEKPITCRPADLIEPQLEALREKAQALGILKSEEDLLTYALYPAIAPKFLRGEMKEEPLPSVAKEPLPLPVAAEPTEFEVEVDGETFMVKIKPSEEKANGERTKTKEPKKKISSATQLPAGAIFSPMHGMVLALKVKKGDKVEKGDVIVILEAMKMQTPIHSDHAGIVREIFSFESEIVSAGDPLLVVN
jgi:pyruvate carboxylase subunit B